MRNQFRVKAIVVPVAAAAMTIIVCFFLYSAITGDAELAVVQRGEVIPAGVEGIAPAGVGIRPRPAQAKSSSAPKALEDPTEECGCGDTPDDVRRAILSDVENNTNGQDAAVTAGFSPAGVDAILSPGTPLRIDDMPAELRSMIEAELAAYRERGYDEVESRRVDDIVNIEKYVRLEPIKNMPFELSTLPGSIADAYEYIGYTFPNAIITQSDEETHDTVRRAYKNDDGLIVVEETSLESGGVNLIEEFVNGYVNESPSSYCVKKTEKGDVYAALTWSVQDRAYVLYQVGAVTEETSDQMTSTASGITTDTIIDTKQEMAGEEEWTGNK